MSDTASVTLLHGTDEYAIAAHIEKLVTALGDPSIADMNIARFDGRAGLNFESLNTAINSIPFISPRRLVVLVHPSSAFPTGRTQKQAPSIPAAQADVPPSEQRKIFLKLLDSVPPTTNLVLVETDTLKADHWLVKWAQKSGAVIRVYLLPKRGEMSKWIENEARKQGGRLEPQAAALLAEMSSEDTRIAAQEITKLLTYVNYARPVTSADVEQVSIVRTQGDVFSLVDALGTGNGQIAQKMLHRLLENEETFSLWGMVIRQFRLLLLAREMIDSNATLVEMQSALHVHEFVAQKIYNQAKRFSMPELEAIYHRLLEIDEGAKTSQVTLDLALDMLVVELAGQ